MRVLFFAFALLSCLSLSLAAPPPFYDSKVIFPLTSENFRSEIGNEQQAVLVNFYLPRNSHCKELKPEYLQVSKTLGANIKVAAVDCATAPDICAEQQVTDKRVPVVKLFIQGKTIPYKGPPKAKDIVPFVWDSFPKGLVKLLDKQSIKQRDVSIPRAILFTDKKETPPLLKSIALAMSGRVAVGEVRKTERAILDGYGVGSNFPILLVEPAGGKTPQIYQGKLERSAILTYLESFVSGEGEGNNNNLLTSIPELKDHSCLDTHCISSGKLCLALVLASHDHPETIKNIVKLKTIQQQLESNSRLKSMFNLVWIDGTAQNDFIHKNFELSPQDYAQLALISVKKNRWAPYVGSFNSDSVLEFLTDVLNGKIKTIPVTTQDGVFAPIKSTEGVEHCPKPQVEEKAEKAENTDSKDAGKKTTEIRPTLDEFGKSLDLTDSNFDEVVMNNRGAWMILFNNSLATSVDPKFVNVSSDWQKVARKSKNMIRFGVIDVALPENKNLLKNLGVLDQLKVETMQNPRVFSLPPGDKVWESLSMHEFHGDLTALSLYESSLTLLHEHAIYHVSSKDFNKFMGDVAATQPFVPRLVLFSNAKRTPELLRAISIELEYDVQIALAKSTDVDLMKQFNVQKLPALFVLLLSPENMSDIKNAKPGTQVQLKINANLYDGPMHFAAITAFARAVAKEQLKFDEMRLGPDAEKSKAAHMKNLVKARNADPMKGVRKDEL